eukprot:jgi/Botrbrau1/17452/Bobra.0054s0041.1
MVIRKSAMAYISASGTGFKLSAKDTSIEVSDQTTDWEKWIVATEGGVTTFKGRSGNIGYLSIQPDGSITYTDGVDDTAKFELTPNADGTVAIKSIATGKFLGSSEYTTVVVDEPFGWTVAIADAPAAAPEEAPIPPMGEEIPLPAPEDVPVAFQGQ